MGLGPLQGTSIYCLIDGPGQLGILPAALEGAWLCQRVDVPGEAWPAASSAIQGLFPLAPSASRGTQVRGAPGLAHLQPQRLLPAEEHLPVLASEGRVALQVAGLMLGMAEWARGRQLQNIMWGQTSNRGGLWGASKQAGGSGISENPLLGDA